MNKVEVFNISLDHGHLMINDSKAFQEINEEIITERACLNVKHLYDELFKTLKKQKGEEDEKRDFDKPEDMVKLPKPLLVLPRSKPCPKAKPLTKWERYRTDKGLAPSQKKSRMIWSEEAKDCVPRWGKGR
jgi:regulator of ribosome biosynthesis